MEVKKKFFNRIGALLCALVVLVGCFANSGMFYADEVSNASIVSYLERIGLLELFQENGFVYNENYKYMVGADRYDSSDSYYYRVRLIEYKLSGGSVPVFYADSSSGSLKGNHKGGSVMYSFDLHSNGNLSKVTKESNSTSSFYTLCGYGFNSFNDSVCYYNDFEVQKSKTNNEIILGSTSWYKVRFVINGDKCEIVNDEVQDKSIGYLMDVVCTDAYIRGKLYNYDEESLTRKWRYSQYTTTGLDLCIGDYSIRHYIKPVAVVGYTKDDIKKEFDMYLMKEYEASPLYFTYLQKDYDDIMAIQGYDGLGFVEMYLKGWFILYHHYFQIVDNESGAVGGYVHMYPYDADGKNAVEYIGETLDSDMNVDPNGYSGVVSERENGSGETIEEAFENAKPESEKGIDLKGVEDFSNVLTSYVGQVANVSNGIGALLQCLPPWMVVSLGIGISLVAFVGVVKVLRG